MPSEISTVSGDRPVKDLKRELAEAREQQAATAEILKVISSSPTDLHRVMATVAHNAAQVCGANDAQVYRINNGALHIVASCGAVGATASARIDGLPLTRGTVTGRAFLDRQSIHVPDLAAVLETEFPDSRSYQKELGFRTTLATPLLSKNIPIGVITIRRMTVNPFSDKQIAMLETFADQAVIAIENTRLFEAEQASKHELQESLEYQTATSEVLNVISRSPTQLQPVVNVIVQTAKRLCGAERANMWRVHESTFDLIASTISDTELAAYLAENPIPSGPKSLAGRAVLERRVIHVPDVATDRELDSQTQLQRSGVRTMLVVPLLRKGEPIGVLSLSKTEVRPFSGKQIALVTTFADQAVIAIENTRLFEAEQARTREVTERTRELTEALEQQTATADVLKVISRSALDLQRVLDALVESATRLCNAYDAVILQVFSDGLRLVAHRGQIPTPGPVGQATIPLVRGLIAGRAVLEGRTIQVADIQAEADEYPESRRLALQLGYRTVLCVPLVHAGEAIGVILIRRAEVRPFAERQIELISTFADQAVIAIENTRLFEAEQTRSRELSERTQELTETLEYQTATSDVLGVIAASPTDIQPVLQTLVESACRLCAAYDGIILLREGEWLQVKAHHGPIPANVAKRKIARNWVNGRCVADRVQIHVRDLQAEVAEYPEGAALAQRLGARTILATPLMREGEAIGAIMIRRGAPVLGQADRAP
jgi:GAF domain-containing protein